MKNIRYFFVKTLYKISGNNKEVISSYFRRAGMKIGKGCNICSNIMTTEPYLVEIGDQVTISGDVKLVTHDNSISKLNIGGKDIFGKIVIGDNCFIGQSSIIMYGVHLKKNTIVAAGSVVCNSLYEEKIIIGGNPAKKIGNWGEFAKKNKNFVINRKQAKRDVKMNKEERFVIKKEM